MLEELPDLAIYTVIKPVGGPDQFAAARKAVFMAVVIP